MARHVLEVEHKALELSKKALIKISCRRWT